MDVMASRADRKAWMLGSTLVGLAKAVIKETPVVAADCGLLLQMVVESILAVREVQ